MITLKDNTIVIDDEFGEEPLVYKYNTTKELVLWLQKVEREDVIRMLYPMENIEDLTK